MAETSDDLVNVMFSDAGTPRRIGYRTLWGLLWTVIRVNRSCRRHGVRVKLDIALPVPLHPIGKRDG